MFVTMETSQTLIPPYVAVAVDSSDIHESIAEMMLLSVTLVKSRLGICDDKNKYDDGNTSRPL